MIVVQTTTRHTAKNSEAWTEVGKEAEDHILRAHAKCRSPRCQVLNEKASILCRASGKVTHAVPSKRMPGPEDEQKDLEPKPYSTLQAELNPFP